MVRKKYKPLDKTFRILLFVVMSIFALSYVLLLFWMIFSSLRSVSNFNKYPFKMFDMTMKSIVKNYNKAFTYKAYGTTAMPTMILNSAIYVFGTVLLAVLFPNIAGYIVAKYKFKLNGFITNLAIVTMVIPTIGSVTTTYRFLDTINMLNKFEGVFLMSAGGFGFGFLLFRNFYAAIPWEYAESAFLDGASNWRVFTSIMAPQARPIIVSIAIVSFISCWNDYYTPYMYLNEYPTVAYGLQAIYTKYQTSMPYVFAAMTFTTGVVLVVFCCFSKTIMNSMSAGGLKG
ncbi:MAG: carbohydrate ABC transporter permease [Clostridia bacterium]|nr:carbohydrate ABC transporter permease [Clostridia bacterium]